jgi:hypothetical protein
VPAAEQHGTGQQCPAHGALRSDDAYVQEAVVRPCVWEQHEPAWQDPEVSYHHRLRPPNQRLTTVEAHLELMGLAVEARQPGDGVAEPPQARLQQGRRGLDHRRVQAHAYHGDKGPAVGNCEVHLALVPTETDPKRGFESEGHTQSARSQVGRAQRQDRERSSSTRESLRASSDSAIAARGEDQLCPSGNHVAGENSDALHPGALLRSIV